jgi:hypothetical protein
MKQFIAVSVLIFCFTSTSYSQKANTGAWLKLKLKRADSVLITAHEPTKGIVRIDSAGNQMPSPKLILDGKPNYGVIRESKFIKGKAVDSLIQILDRPFKNNSLPVTLAACYVPRHSIFVFNGNQLSYIDICFECNRWERSEDLSKLGEFDSRKWREIKAFMISQGLTYKLTNNMGGI